MYSELSKLIASRRLLVPRQPRLELSSLSGHSHNAVLRRDKVALTTRSACNPKEPGGVRLFNSDTTTTTTNRSNTRSFHIDSVRNQRSTPTVLAPQEALQAAVPLDETVEPHHPADDDQDVELFAAECISQLLPTNRHHHVPSSSSPQEQSSLDLELGEQSIWDAAAAPWVEPEPLPEDNRHDEEEPLMSTPAAGEASATTQTTCTRPTSSPPRRRSAVELLMDFDPQNPPITDNPYDLQLWLECEAQQEAVMRYQKAIDSARARKDYSSLSLVQRQVLRWFQPLQKAIAKRQEGYVLRKGEVTKQTSATRYGPYLCTLPPEKLAVIVAHEAIMCALLKSGGDGREGVPFVAMARRIGDAVEEEVLIHRALHKRFKDAQAQRQKETGIIFETDPVVSSTVNASQVETNKRTDDENIAHKWFYAPSHLRAYLDEISRHDPSAKRRRVVSYAIRRARQLLEKDEEWSVQEKVQLGAALFQILLEKATVFTDDGKDEMAFTYEKRWVAKHKLKSFVQLNDRLYKMVVSDQLHSFAATTTRYKPMILPPKPWRALNDGGYLWLKADLMRYHGCHTQKEALQNGDLSTIYDGLNVLGSVPWQINKRVLEVAEKCWEDDIPLGDIPSQTDYEVPPEPLKPDRPSRDMDKESPAYKEIIGENQRYRDALQKVRRIRQRNMDLRSLRCSAMLKLDQAEKFKEFDEIYFPYNMDFRGRAYPVPPHLSNVGSDLCRGMLKFAEAKPLGPRGLYWLKVHLANFAGKDKMSFDQRAAFVDENIARVRQSAEDPFAGERWWMELEDPFQGLATCIEIINAIDSGDPESYPCSLPVHMDGSCNGLQHYAALGRDIVGGKAVNLCAVDEPQDVYVGVMHEVIRRVAEEAERTIDFETDGNMDSLNRKQKKALDNNRAAKLVNGLIDRGVVKRTVMTSVYGVTFIGARQQIQEKIESKLEAQGYDVDEMQHEIFRACGYLARVTMDVMGDLFTGAKETMNWLTTCARMISQHGYPVAWISPIGLPAIQPYRQKKTSTLVTLLQTVTLADDSDDLPLHKQRQVTAFPPNYVHSLDSSHMLLTALEMDRRGLAFSAVHDSFWTHACDIDEMNEALRDVFVDLYNQPLLERLKKTWELRYPDLEFPDLPKRGDLDLNEVKRAKYFFQ